VGGRGAGRARRVLPSGRWGRQPGDGRDASRLSTSGHRRSPGDARRTPHRHGTAARLVRR
jgi:hypothetical protein